MRSLLAVLTVAALGCSSGTADPAPDVSPAPAATLEAFDGWWLIDSQILTKNECPFKDEDFLRPEVEGAYLFLKAGPNGTTLIGSECETRDPQSCNPDYNTTFDFADGVATLDQNRIRELTPTEGYTCKNHQRDLHTLTVSGDALTATTETFVDVQGPDCDAAEAELQQLSGKSVPLDECDIVWLLQATRQP